MRYTDQASAGRKLGPVEVISILFTAACLAVWMWNLPVVLSMLEWAIRYHKGDTGYHVLLVVPVAGGGGLIGTAVAVPLAILAKRLPRWLRILMVALPAGGIVFALTQILGLFWGVN